MYIQISFSFFESFHFSLCASAIISFTVSPFAVSPFSSVFDMTLFVVLVFNSVNTKQVVAGWFCLNVRPAFSF